MSSSDGRNAELGRHGRPDEAAAQRLSPCSAGVAAGILRLSSDELRGEEALFAITEKLVRAAVNSSRQGNLRNAATHLERAHQIAAKRAGEGLLAGRVARAAIGVQYCALLSRAGRHSQALNEALAAVVEAEEVWCIVEGSSSEVLPSLTRRAICALVQAKHSVALELEYSLAEESAETAAAREGLIPSLHAEAAEVASQWLPPGHPVRELSERTEAQFRVRSAGSEGGGDAADPFGLGQMREVTPPPATSPAPQDTPEFPVVHGAAVEGLPEGGPRSGTPSAHSGLSRPTSAAKLQTLEEQALPPPKDGRRPSGSLTAQTEELPRSRGSVLWDGARDRIFSRERSSAHSGSMYGSKSGFGDRKRQFYSGEDGYDLFRQCGQKNLPKHAKGSIIQRIATEAGFVELKHEMQTKSRIFHIQEIPRFTPEDLYENKVLFSGYGVKVRHQATRREEKAAASAGQSSSKRRSAHHENLVSIKTLKERLRESHDKTEFAQEFYGARKPKTHDVFESLRHAFHTSTESKVS